MLFYVSISLFFVSVYLCAGLYLSVLSLCIVVCLGIISMYSGIFRSYSCVLSYLWLLSMCIVVSMCIAVSMGMLAAK